MLPTKFPFIWPNGLRGEASKKSANQKPESPVAAMLVNGSGRMSNLYRGSSIVASYQASVHLTKRFQRRRILKSAYQKQESPVAAMFVNGSG
jgi:hypothetical protein